jgi:hypothetical protein
MVALLISTHRLPAPISEVETPTPTPEQSAKPKPKSLLRPKKIRTADSSTTPARQQPISKQSRFAGTWVGTIPAFPTGAQDTILTVDSKETTMSHLWTSHPPTDIAKAEIVGDTIRATFHANVTFTFSVTPKPDGVTAIVRLQAFMNDDTAVFHRAAEPVAAKSAQ